MRVQQPASVPPRPIPPGLIPSPAPRPPPAPPPAADLSYREVPRRLDQLGIGVQPLGKVRCFGESGVQAGGRDRGAKSLLALGLAQYHGERLLHRSVPSQTGHCGAVCVERVGICGSAALRRRKEAVSLPRRGKLIVARYKPKACRHAQAKQERELAKARERAEKEARPEKPTPAEALRVAMEPR